MRFSGLLRFLSAGVLAVSANAALANLIVNGDFESAGLNTTNTSISGSTGPFGEWIALDGHWTLGSGEASNATNYAENPDFNYILMQGVDLSSFSSPFDTVLSFDYAYEGGFGGLDGRGVRVFGMEATDSLSVFFTGSTFDQVTQLFGQVLNPTGDPTTAFVPFTSPSFSVDPSLYSALAVVYTFGGDPTASQLRAVDNVNLTSPAPVPEPGVLGLLAIGLLALTPLLRRRAA